MAWKRLNEAENDDCAMRQQEDKTPDDMGGGIYVMVAVGCCEPDPILGLRIIVR